MKHVYVTMQQYTKDSWRMQTVNFVTILSADTPRALHRDPAQTRRESPSPQVTSPPLEASGKQTLWTCLGARGTRSRQGT